MPTSFTAGNYYYDVDVVIDGALDEHRTILDIGLLSNYVDGLELWANDHPAAHVEVYILLHEHPASRESCECAQFVTDGHPAHEWNAPPP